MDGSRRFAPVRRIAVLLLVGTAFLVGVGVSGASADKVPTWIKHVKHWDGGISNGVRERLAQANGDIVVSTKQATRGRALAVPALDNVQMNGDSDPPLPQDEPSIAASLDDPMNAVAASNDYTGDGFWIGSTTDGGQTWTSQWKDPKFSFDGGRCFASDPSVAYSLRDHAFYLSTLCYFVTTPASEVQVWKSVDGGNDLELIAQAGPRGDEPRSRRFDRRLDLQRQGADGRRQHAVEPALRAHLRHLDQVPHDGRLVRAQRHLSRPGRLHRFDPDRRSVDLGLDAHGDRPRCPGREGGGSLGEPVLDARRRRPGWAERRVRPGGLQHEHRSRAVLRAIHERRDVLRSGRRASTNRDGSPTTRTRTTTCRARATFGSRTRSRSRTTPRATGWRSSIRTTSIARSRARTSRSRPPTTSGRRGPSRSPSASDRTARPLAATSSSRRSGSTRTASGSRSGRTPGSIRRTI